MLEDWGGMAISKVEETIVQAEYEAAKTHDEVC